MLFKFSHFLIFSDLFCWYITRLVYYLCIINIRMNETMKTTYKCKNYPLNKLHTNARIIH